MARNNSNSPTTPGTMDLHDFTPRQNEALLDLLVLAMYLDGNLAQVEEVRLQQLLTAMGFATDYDRNREFDASVTRVRQQSHTPVAVKTCAAKLAGSFTLGEHKQRVYQLLCDLTALDGSVSSEESKFLVAIRELFKL